MSKGQFRQLTVVETRQISPGIKRIVFGGTSLADFPVAQESGYIKFCFNFDGHALTHASQIEKGLVRRTYTVRRFDPIKKQLSVDFVLHSDGAGPGGRWARDAQPGQEILMAGPGPTKLAKPGQRDYLFVGDMTALPAIAANLELLPSSATGIALIQVNSDEDKQSLTSPPGIEVHWHIETQPKGLLSKLKQLPWPAHVPETWVACEFGQMRELRQFLVQEKQLDRRDMYISSYWRQGRCEEEHKIDKKQDEAGII